MYWSVRVMANQALRLQTLKSMVTRNLFQHSKHLYRYMAATYFTINCKCHQYAHGFVLMKLILEACKA